MNKLFLFFILVCISASLKAQSEFGQISIGAGAGAATTYAGSPIIRTTLAYSGNVCYYPTEFFDIELEAQIGHLGGGQTGTPHLNFSNNYQAIVLEPVFHLGLLLDNSENNFLTNFKNLYAGAGYGFIHNRVINIDVVNRYSRNIIPLIPLKVGYEYNFVNYYNNPVLKINLSYSINTSIGRGLDGYYGSMHQSVKLFVYYGLQIEYPINLIQNYGRGRLKFY
jgi:hypothetical protein